MQRIRAGIAAAAFILTAAEAQAQSYSQTLAPAPVNSSATLDFPQYNGSNPLSGITVSADTTLSGSIQVESLEAAPTTFAASVSASTIVTSPGATLLTVPNFASVSASLAAFDGTIDYAGPSGRTLAFSQSASGSTTITAGTGAIPLAPFVGSGAVPIGVSNSGSASLTAPLNVSAKLSSALGVTVGLSYASAANGQSGSTTSSGGFNSGTGGGLIGVGLAGSLTTPTQSKTVAPATTGWTQTLSFAKFNPLLGSLVSVNLGIDGALAATFSAAGIQPTDAYALTQTGGLTLATAGGSVLDAAATTLGRDGAGALDGPNLLSADLSNAATDSAGLADFTGAGDVTLLASALGSLSGTTPATADIESRGTEGGAFTLSYTYLPGQGVAADLVSAPEPGALALAVTGLAGLLAVRRGASSRV